MVIIHKISLISIKSKIIEGLINCIDLLMNKQDSVISVDLIDYFGNIETNERFG